MKSVVTGVLQAAFVADTVIVVMISLPVLLEVVTKLRFEPPLAGLPTNVLFADQLILSDPDNVLKLILISSPEQASISVGTGSNTGDG